MRERERERERERGREGRRVGEAQGKGDKAGTQKQRDSECKQISISLTQYNKITCIHVHVLGALLKTKRANIPFHTLSYVCT